MRRIWKVISTGSWSSLFLLVMVCDRMKLPRSRRANRAPGRGHKAGEGSADRRDFTGRFVLLLTTVRRRRHRCLKETERRDTALQAGVVGRSPALGCGRSPDRATLLDRRSPDM